MILSEQRKRKGMKQDDVAKILNIDRSTVAKWENGITYPRPPMLTKLAKTLNVTEGDIIEAITTAKNQNKPA